MVKLIINADDFGYSEGVNAGIISAHKKGIVTSTTIMSNMPAYEDGIKLLRENKTLKCGVHLTMSCYKPLLKTHKTIVDENGNFYRRVSNENLKNMDKEEIYNEFCAQIDKVIESKIEIDHIDSHHHIHTLEGLKDVMEKILDKYNLPIRGGFEYDAKFDNTVYLIDSFYSDRIDESYFKDNINEIKEYEIADIMCHPAFVDDFLLSSTSYAIQREKEHDILISDEIKSFLKDNNILLTNYKKEYNLENKILKCIDN